MNSSIFSGIRLLINAITTHHSQTVSPSMTSVAEKIRYQLNFTFAPAALEVIDDSAKHAGHAGARPQGESHFTVRITSERFEGLSRVARHRAVYEVLKPLFDQGLHALAIDARSPAEAG